MVYFISDGNHVKIGYTKSDDINKRLKGLQTSSPETLIVEGLIKNANERDERELHKLFKDERQRGEWFKLTNRLKYFIGLVRRELFVSKINDITYIIPPSLNLHKAMGELEKMLIIRSLERCNNVQSKAAKMLGISRRVIHYKIKQLGL